MKVAEIIILLIVAAAAQMGFRSVDSFLFTPFTTKIEWD